MAAHRRHPALACCLLALASPLRASADEMRPSLPLSALAQDADAQVRALVEQMLSLSPEHPVSEAAAALGLMGPRAAPAVPFLIDLLREVQEGGPGPSEAITGPAGGTSATALARIGKPAVEPLLQALKSGDRTTCANAIAALAGIDDPRAEVAVLGALGHDEYWVRMTAANKVAQWGRKMVPVLSELLAGEDPRVREQAVTALREIGGATVVPPLIGALSDADAQVRTRAAYALAQTDPRPALEALWTAAHDEDAQVRKAALYTIKSSEAPQVGRWLAAAGEGEPREVRDAALSWMARHTPDDPRLWQMLAAELQRPETECYGAVQLLSHLGGDRAAEMLLGYAAKQFWDQSDIIEALARCHSPLVVPFLVEALGHPLEWIRRAAARGLGELRPTEAVDALLKTLVEDQDLEAAQAAADALGKIGDPRAVGGLLQALETSATGVGDSAARALAGMDDPDLIRRVEPIYDEGDDVRRRRVVYALRETKSILGRKLLLRAMRDPDEELARAAVQSLGTPQSEDELAAMAAAVGSDDPVVRAVAVQALAAMHDPRTADRLLSVLSEGERSQDRGHPHVSGLSPVEAAALELARQGDRRAVEPLVACLQRPPVPYTVFVALVHLRDPRAVPPLRALLLERTRDSARAAWALGQLGAKEAVPDLLAAASGRPGGPAPSSEEAGYSGTMENAGAAAAIAALAQMRVPEVADVALRLLSGPVPYGALYCASEALAELGDRRAVQPLLDLLDRPHYWAQFNPGLSAMGIAGVASTLGRLGDPRAVPVLSKLLDGQWGFTAALALVRIGGPEARQALEGLRDDCSLEVRYLAAMGLGERPDPELVRTSTYRPGAGDTPSSGSRVIRAMLGDTRIVGELLSFGGAGHWWLSRPEFELMRTATGEAIGDDPIAWEQWWDGNKPQ